MEYSEIAQEIQKEKNRIIALTEQLKQAEIKKAAEHIYKNKLNQQQIESLLTLVVNEFAK